MLEFSSLNFPFLAHRGACVCDNDSGDGAGVMTAIPDKLYRDEMSKWVPSKSSCLWLSITCYLTIHIICFFPQLTHFSTIPFRCAPSDLPKSLDLFLSTLLLISIFNPLSIDQIQHWSAPFRPICHRHLVPEPGVLQTGQRGLSGVGPGLRAEADHLAQIESQPGMPGGRVAEDGAADAPGQGVCE